MIDRLLISYGEYGLLMDELASRLTGNYTAVYGPPRGGLPIAVHLSHHLGIPLAVTCQELFDMLDAVESPHALIVDDIADTGRSLAELIELFRRIDIPLTTAVLFRKQRSVVTPGIWLREVSNSSWVVFPWECPDETPNREICPHPPAPSPTAPSTSLSDRAGEG
jgi:hypoxanthine phosphoribosyltransferase